MRGWSILLGLIAFSSVVLADHIDDYLITIRKKSKGHPTLWAGFVVDSWSTCSNVWPEEMPTGYLENSILNPNKATVKNPRWPNGIVPFEISSNFDPNVQMNLVNLMAYVEQRCGGQVSFVPRTIEDNYVCFEDKFSGCWSPLGRLGGKQIINLQQPNCLVSNRTPLHLILQTLGVGHEHTRADRDNFVDIEKDGIRPGFKCNFNKYKKYKLHTPYDYHSIMHITTLTNAYRDVPTFIGRKPVNMIGWTSDLSDGDVAKILELYPARPRILPSALNSNVGSYVIIQ